MRRSTKIAGLAAWVVLIGGFLALLFFGFQTYRSAWRPVTVSLSIRPIEPIPKD